MADDKITDEKLIPLLGVSRDPGAALVLVGLVMDNRLTSTADAFFHGLLLAFEHPEYARALYRAALVDGDFAEAVEMTRANLQVLTTICPVRAEETL